MNYFKYLMFLCFFCVSFDIHASVVEREFSPPPFEKIYVGPNDVMTTPQGIFYINCWGQKRPVCSVMTDCEGMYVIIIERQCPICGGCCSGFKAPEGYDCPFGKTEVLPHIWAEP